MVMEVRVLLFVFQTLTSKSVFDEKQPCSLADGLEVKTADDNRIECLLVHVTESTPEEKDKYKSQYLSLLEWVTFSSGEFLNVS